MEKLSTTVPFARVVRERDCSVFEVLGASVEFLVGPQPGDEAPSKHGRYFQEIGRRLASGECVRPPTFDEIQHFLETARRYGYWFATPEENASVGITVR